MSNEIRTRPLTPTEQKYTYAQSMQLEGQTGTIGHLTGHFVSLLSVIGGWGGVLPPHFGQKKAGDLFQIS